MFVISAPAKCILFGEHSVVYGHQALAATLDLLTFCYVEPLEQLELLINDDNAQEAFKALAKDLKITKGRFHVKSEIPIGAGLGSSASFCVCIATGLLLLGSKISTKLAKEDLDTVNKYAFKAEQVIHGTCSGLDNTMSTFGGYKLYDHNKMEDLDFGDLKFILINTKIPKSTKDQVSKFKSRLEKYPQIMEPLLQGMGAIPSNFIELCVRRVGHEFKEKEFNLRVEELIELNQGFLFSAGMSTAVIDTTVANLQNFGLSTKITGSGGGGCLLSFLPGKYVDRWGGHR